METIPRGWLIPLYESTRLCVPTCAGRCAWRRFRRLHDGLLPHRLAGVTLALFRHCQCEYDAFSFHCFFISSISDSGDERNATLSDEKSTHHLQSPASLSYCRDSDHAFPFLHSTCGLQSRPGQVYYSKYSGSSFLTEVDESSLYSVNCNLIPILTIAL